MTIHIKGAKIIAMDAARGSETFDGDILIEGQRIVAMGAALPEAQADIVIEGHDKLVTPGFVHAHIHTPEALFRGRYENLPLEMWMTLAYFLVGNGQLAPIGRRIDREDSPGARCPRDGSAEEPDGATAGYGHGLPREVVRERGENGVAEGLLQGSDFGRDFVAGLLEKSAINSI